MIIAIGGGEIKNKETYPIDEFIVRKAGKDRPRFLFIPTASKDSIVYVEEIRRLYEGLGCLVDSLLLLDEGMTKSIAKEKISLADIVYVGGGDTEFMMNKWKEFGLDEFLIEAYKEKNLSWP